jgi:uncharacterized protein YggE
MSATTPRTPARSQWGAVATFLSLWLVAAAAAPAQQQGGSSQEQGGGGAGEGISVAGTGEVKAKPTSVEINATISGDAELAADAIVKYRDARRRAIEALNGLKLEGLKIDTGGFSVAQGMDPAQAQAMMQGNSTSAGKARVNVSEQLKLTLSGLEKFKEEELMDTVLKVLDTGRDAGLVIGRPTPRNYYEMQMYYNSGNAATGNLVAFKLTDPDALREQAYKQAMDDARKKAERLASLAGVKLGRIKSVKDAGSGGTGNASNPQAAMMMMAVYGAAVPQDNSAELTSPVFKEISVKVNLAVQFEIAK